MNLSAALKYTLILFIFVGYNTHKAKAQTGCRPLQSQGQLAPTQHDPFYQILSQSVKCPQNIDEVSLLLSTSLQNRKFLVANRGRNNPKFGSFSIFESFSGAAQSSEARIFLGHFTQVKNLHGKNVIDLDQVPDKGKLVIELIAWDDQKGYYNFYELIGQGGFTQWFYRGDSKDILLDNQAIYLSQPPQFGQRLRCSGCHISGGPIMKELAFPHNDWWTKSRPLVFEQPPSDSFMKKLQVLDSAENLSTLVQTGINKLEQSLQYQKLKKSFSIQVQLRPLFCDLEINIQSDMNAFDANADIQIPTASLGGPFVGSKQILISKRTYQALLQKYGMMFPETKLADSDHAWLTPVKSYSDLLAIKSLKASGLVDDKTILDIYFSAPIGALMNQERCQLLKLVPNTPNWKTQFLQNLKSQSSSVAKSMLFRMTNAQLTPMAYQKAISEWYELVNHKLQSNKADEFFSQLLINRKAVLESDISKNPKGQILEPGFRVIFPVSRR